jgi:hypothetical protein
MRLTPFLALILLAATPARAAEVCKPSGKPITLNFETQTAKPVYNNRLDVAGIRNLFALRGQTLSGPHSRALGVTYEQTVLSLSGDSIVIKSGRGYCVALDKVDAAFGWDRMEVYVASEFKPGECAYNAVLDHENQHVAINQAALKEFAPRMRSLLEKVLAEQRPIYFANSQGGADAILQAVHQRMGDAAEQFQKVLSERNGVIDTDSNYDAIAALCPDWKRPEDKKKPKAR